MSSVRRPWRLLHPVWLLVHVFVAATAVVMIKLGQWQWHQAHRHHGEILNYSYALQWWAFTAFGILMWLRVMRDYLRSHGTVRTVEPAAAPAPARYVAYQPPQRVAEPEDDPERARFNAYLKSLYAVDGEDSG